MRQNAARKDIIAILKKIKRCRKVLKNQQGTYLHDHERLIHSKCQCLIVDLLLIDRQGHPGKELLLQANWLQSRQRMLSEEFEQFDMNLHSLY